MSAEWTQTTIDCDTLVSRLEKPNDEAAWRLAVGRYGPLVQGFARRMGIPADLAEDARQEALEAFVRGIRAGKFERSRGRLRDYLFGIARNRILSLRDRESRQRRTGLQPDESRFWEGVSDDSQMESIWEAEWQDAVSAQCLREAQAHFSSETYGIFERHALDRVPSERVAQELGKTVNAVNLATNRVRSFLRRIRPAIEEAL